jgi:hypothetical protein
VELERGKDMTVLGGNQATGLGTGAVRKYLAGVAVAIVGIGAAFGLSRLIDEEQPTVYSGPMVERSVAMQDSVDTIREGATAQSRGAAASSMTLEQELAQIHGGPGPQPSNAAPASQPGGPR